MTEVDVVVPCYNYGLYLERCVGSILSQADVDVRVLIIDDASSDNSAEIGQQLAVRDRRVTFHRNAKNKGLVGTANLGVIDWAEAKYTALISADDALTQGALSRATHVMEKHDDVGMTYGMALVVSSDSEMIDVNAGRDVGEVKDAMEQNYCVLSGSEFLKQICEHWCGVASPTAVARTRIQKLVGGHHPDYPHTCDVEMWMRFATRSSIAVLPTTQAYYRWHGSNMSKSFIYRPMSDLREQLATANEVLTKWGSDIPEFPDWISAMKLRFVGQACWMAGLALERGDLAASRDCLAFARENSSSLWRSRAWWHYQAKRCLGRSLTKKMRSALRGNQAENEIPFAMLAPFKHGEIFGWWPERSLPKSTGAS
jgi:glycosyltransferase involved in cell wall biosynthesis